MGQSTEELSSEIAGTRQNLASDLDALQDRVSPSAIMERRKAAAKGRLRGMKERVMGSAQDVAGGTRSGVSSGVSGVQSGMQSGVQGAKDTAGEAVDTARERFEGSPLAAGLVAFGAGLVISALLPASEKEARAGAQLVEQAQDRAQPMMEEAKAAGQEMGQRLASSAAEAAQEVKQTAVEGAQNVRSEGQSSAQSVASEVRPDSTT